ncbi:MAG TPA: histidine kinase famiy protein [Ramlibacter sp.]|jgi:PAS domain S-box-containing protein|uniref:histidine kinase famiy protein n=1 Tax=Ramlibacter sp. TaxID=1917967 RepID=UPI002D2231F8|nr:histidine kinase famiy protein [Ramlibacter sp.]HZY17949.1 histidine kinase famiy protein [Ramlibacter sp.]
MTVGRDPTDPRQQQQLDTEGGGQSGGVPAAGELEGSSYNPLGNPGLRHWQASYITRPGIEDRDNVFFAAVEMTRMPMVVTDPNQPDNPVVFINRAFLDLTGYSREQVLGRNCRFLQGELTDPATVAEVREAVRERRAVAVDILNYKADGSHFWNALFAGPIFDAEGRLLYWFSSQLDITHRRAAEQTFRQAQKMEAIGQLTAGLAHDFNNLLQVISGNLELALMHAGDNATLRTAIERATQAAAKGGRLTQQLLTFARKQRLEPRRVNLNTLVVEFSDMLMRTLGEQVDLRLDLRPALPVCTLDPVHMEMALLNVLINARDAMPGGGRVTVGTSLVQESGRAGEQAAPGQYVALCVTDEGEGMTPDVRRRATEPFFTTKGPGTGLGLAMVHGFVQQSHGRLEIESEPGRGTTVRMLFPVASERAVQGDAAPAPAEQTGTRTVLLVEDSDDIREVAEIYLQSLGWRVLAAASGEQALQILQEQPVPDLLFTDVLMPGGMNGVQLAERARRLHPELPVLLTTGYMDELLTYGQRTAQMVTLGKPYRRTDLAESIRQTLAKAQAQAQERVRAPASAMPQRRQTSAG